MAQMLLTSPARAMMYTGLIDESGDDPVNLRSIKSWLPGISSRIEQYCNRQFEIKERTEYWDAIADQVEYTTICGGPICHVNKVEASSMGLYTGEEYLIINYYTSRFGQAISLNYPVMRWRKGLRAIYTGGYARHGTQSTFAITSSTGTWAVGNYVVGGTSLACGTVTAVSASSNYITIDNLYGIFTVGETLTARDSEFTVGSATGTAVITAASDSDLTKITMAINTSAGAWTAGKYVKGTSSGCIGVITDVGATYVTCTWYYAGVQSNFFTVGETLVEQDSSSAVGTSTGTAVMTAFVNRSLAEAFPEITTACEIELRFMQKHSHDYENLGTTKESTSRRPDLYKYVLQPETISMLAPHYRYFL
jgi:hypothetical protein